MRIHNENLDAIEVILRNEDGFSFFRASLPEQQSAFFSGFFKVDLRQDLDPGAGKPAVVAVDCVTVAPEAFVDPVTGEPVGGTDPTEVNDGTEPTEVNDGDDGVAAFGVEIANNTGKVIKLVVGPGAEQDFPSGQTPARLQAAQVTFSATEEGLKVVIPQNVPLSEPAASRELETYSAAS